MTTLVPLPLGCSGFALGLLGSVGVVALIALGGCSCPLGWATTDGGLRVLLECTELVSVDVGVLWCGWCDSSWVGLGAAM